jgi:hypothetical protein
MSRQNKVNPGMYTQRGRLTPDDTAREMKKQRGSVAPATARDFKFREHQQSRALQAMSSQGDDQAENVERPRKDTSKKPATAEPKNAAKASSKARPAKSAAKAKATATSKTRAKSKPRARKPPTARATRKQTQTKSKK